MTFSQINYYVTTQKIQERTTVGNQEASS